MRRYLILLTGLVGSVTTAAIVSGAVIVGRGDPPTRILKSFDAARDLPAFALDWANWAGTWPAGYFLFQGAFIDLMSLVGVRDLSMLVQGVLWLSTLAWGTIVLSSFSAVRRAMDSESGWLVVAGLLALPLLTELAHNAYPGIYFAALYTCCLRALVEFEITRAARWLVLAGICLLIASTVRSEAFVAAVGLALVLWIRHGPRQAAAFFSLAATLTLFRMANALTDSWLTANVFAQAPEEWPARSVDFLTLLLYFMVPNAIVLGVFNRMLRVRAPTLSARVADPRQVLGEYAAVSTLFLFSFMFGAMFFMPVLGPDARFLLVPCVGTVITFVSWAGASTHEAWSRTKRWLWPWVSVSLAIQLGVLGPDFLTDRARPFTELQEAAEWLKMRGPPGRTIAVDHLSWWESTLLLYATPSREVLERSYVPTNVPSLDGFARPTATQVDIAGAYLELYRPTYLVLPGPVPRSRREAGHWISVGSFLEPWMSEGSGSFSVTPLGARAPRASARLAFENAWVEIFEVEWLPPS